MKVHEKTRWKNWADGLRQEMMTNLKTEVTKSVDSIIRETASTITESTLRSARFWRACQSGEPANEHLAKAGFEIEFQEDENRKVRQVTLKLNQTWMTILNRALERRVKPSESDRS